MGVGKGEYAGIRAYMLDWDGTLIESLSLKIRNAAHLFSKRYGADPEAVTHCYATHSGIPRRQLFDRIASECLGWTFEDDAFEDLSLAFSEANRAEIREQGELRSGTLAALEALNRKGTLLFVSTAAAQEEMEPLAEHFGVAALCKNVFGSRPGFSKGPEHVAYVRDRFELKAEEMAGVGDDISDMRLFRAAGILPIGITGTRSRAELTAEGAVYVIDHLQELN